MMRKEWHNSACIDFDGVIFEYATPREGQPVKGAIEGLYRLVDAGWYIDVYSGRSATPEGIESMIQQIARADNEYRRNEGIGIEVLGLLQTGQVRFPSVKPTAKVYVDDRGWRFTDWSVVTPDNLEALRTWWQHPDSTK